MAAVMMESACPASKPTSCYWKKIWKGLNVMRQNWEFCDVVLTSNDNKPFMAHRAMLVASSLTFMSYFSDDEGKDKFGSSSKTSLHFQEVSSDVLQVVLDFIYGITPTDPLDVVKLCLGAQYFSIDEAYEYSVKYFGESEFQMRFQSIHSIVDQQIIPSSQSTRTQATTTLDNQATDQSSTSKGPTAAACWVAPKSVHNYHGVLSPDVTDSDSNDGRVDGIAELSLTDLALGNECPHLRKLVGQTGGDGILDFDVELTKKFDFRDKQCLSELEEIINSDEGINDLPSFLSEEIDGTGQSCVSSQSRAPPGCTAQNYLGFEGDSSNNESQACPNRSSEDDLFNFQLDDLGAADAEKIADPACSDASTISEILDGHLGAAVGSGETSYDSDSYSQHVIYDNTASSSSSSATSEHLQNFNQDSSDNVLLHLNGSDDLTHSSAIRHTSKGGESKACPPRKTLKFMCSDCGEAFPTSYKLQTHQLKQHNKGKLFSCLHCPFKSPRKKDLQAHSLSQHGEKPPGVKIYACKSCSYECIDKNRFEEHEAIHQGVLKYNCPLCSKGYTTRRGMKTHLKYHNQNRPFKCSLCPSDFKVKSKLTDHMKLIHFQKGVKPYKCGYCDHYTALRGNCNQHVKKNHPGQPVVVVDTMSSTRRHVKNYDYANLRGSDIDELHEIFSTQLVKKVP